MRIATLLLAYSVLVGCGDAEFPEDFEALPLEQQLEAYENFYREGGLSAGPAAGIISAGGYPAAEAMIPYLVGNGEGPPLDEVLMIVRFVQLRGCSLAGTEVEKAVVALRDRTDDELHRTIATDTLATIEKNRKMPELMGPRGAGACAGEVSDSNR